METSNASAFCTDEEVTEYVNDGLQALYDLLVAARGHEHFASSTSFSTVVGTTDYSLPSDWMSTLKVLATDGGGTYIPVRQWTFDEYHRLLTTGATGDAYTIKGRIQGSNLVLLPAPTAVFTVSHVYIPIFTKLSSDSDTFDGVNGWEEYAVLHAAIAMLTKEESSEQAAMLGAELGRITTRIEKLADHRHATEPDVVQDLRLDGVGELPPRDWIARNGWWH